ncbi:MAG: hypothetical protein K0R29_2235 [Pseudobdellovibrio sp.]|jgi:hypothetical protein|nr:hypothetical protein [Pseudobdellovibrio sp.]
MLSAGAKLFTEIPMVTFGLFLFVSAFVSITARTYFRPSSKEFHQNLAAIPLQEDNNE